MIPKNLGETAHSVRWQDRAGFGVVSPFARAEQRVRVVARFCVGLSAAWRAAWRVVLSAVLSAVLSLVLSTAPCMAQDKDVYTIALFAPGLDFGDSLRKAAFVEQVAQVVSQQSGLPCRGVAFAREGDLRAQARAGKIDYAVVGGAFFAAYGLGKPIAYAKGGAPLALVGKPGSGKDLTALRGKTLILPTPGRTYTRYVSATALGHELKADELFVIKSTKDTKAALEAVRLGQADLTVAFVPYARSRGLDIIYQSGKGPTPVVVRINEELDAEISSRLEGALRSVSVSAAGGIVQGFGGSSEGVRSFRGYAQSRARAIKPAMAEAKAVRFDLDASLTSPLDRLERTGVGELAPAPPLEEESP